MRTIVSLLLALGLCAPGATAFAQSYTFSPLDVPPDIGSDTNPADISDTGIVVGDYFTADVRPCRVGFIQTKGHFETFLHPDAACSASSDLHTVVAGVNNAGDLAGFYQSASRTNDNGQPAVVGFKVVKGMLQDVNVPGAFETQALRIDERGRVVGFFSRADDPQRHEHGFLLDERGYHAIDVPGAVRTWLYSINARGEVTGSFQDDTYVERGFMYGSGTLTLITYPEALLTVPWGLNASGQIAGYAYADGCENAVCAFIYDGNMFSPLAMPNATATYPAAINARRAIVGAFTDPDGLWRGFVALPD